VDEFPGVGAGEAVDHVARPAGAGIARGGVIAGLGIGEFAERSNVFQVHDVSELVVDQVLVARPAEDLLAGLHRDVAAVSRTSADRAPRRA